MKTRTTLILTLTIIITLAAGSALSAYSGGTGDPNDPYQIANVADFNQLTLDPNNWNKAFILTADINLAGVTLTPVGNGSTQFNGVFDGNDNVISNAVINQPGSNNIGLFGRVGYGQIRNLGVEDVNITGYYDVGGLAGGNSSGSLTNCYATGSITSVAMSNSWVGGLVGINSGSLTNCHATSSVTGSRTSFYVGGLVGWNYGTITNCYATGSVSGDRRVGGLVGYNYVSATLTACYATGSVSGGLYVGGLVGMNPGGTITNCYATGSVSGGDIVGGLVGTNSGSLTNCYATGSVSGGDTVGGLVGVLNYGTVTGCFWDINTSGQTTSAGGTGETTAQMQTLSTFTLAGWDFTNETANDINDYWRMCVDGVDYPQLNWQSLDGDLACPDGVNFVDFASFATRWLTAGCSSSNNFCGGVDMDTSGTVDMADLAIFAENWLSGE